MKRFSKRNDPEIAQLLKAGAVGVLKTDTLYGIVASAHDQSAVERVYALRKRDANKASIMLVANTTQLMNPLPAYAHDIARRYWPGKVSIILPIDSTVPVWLHRGQNSLAYRVPADDELRELLNITGPLIAPSANVQGMPPAMSVEEAKAYFGDHVDFYVDSGRVDNEQPSALLRVQPDGSVVQLR